MSHNIKKEALSAITKNWFAPISTKDMQTNLKPVSLKDYQVLVPWGTHMSLFCTVQKNKKKSYEVAYSTGSQTLAMHQSHQEGGLKTQIADHTPGVSDLVDGNISNKFPSDTNTTGPGTTLWEPLVPHALIEIISSSSVYYGLFFEILTDFMREECYGQISWENTGLKEVKRVFFWKSK